MKQLFMLCAVTLFLSNFSISAEKRIKLNDLPPAALKTVRDLVKGAELKGHSQEEENGQTIYEVETIKNGKTRDVLINAAGAIMEIEEAISLKDIPGPAKAAIEKAAVGGKIRKVEAVTKNGATNYEAAITKGWKDSEIKVTADGSIAK
jgi:uncharacterized membrane protein YkoI